MATKPKKAVVEKEAQEQIPQPILDALLKVDDLKRQAQELQEASQKPGQSVLARVRIDVRFGTVQLGLRQASQEYDDLVRNYIESKPKAK